MAYAVGHVSGAHFNPAVTIGIAVAKRFEWREVPAYVGAQVVGGLLAGGALAGLLASTGRPVIGNLAANGYGAHSPGGFALGAVLITEALVTAFFVYIILGATKDDAPKGFAPLAIGFGLLIGHLVAIPISNASLNPARSTAVAFFNGNGAVGPALGLLGRPDRRRPHRRRRRTRGSPANSASTSTSAARPTPSPTPPSTPRAARSSTMNPAI